MRMLKEDEEVDAEVTREDQENINAFSKLNAKFGSLEEAFQAKKTEKEYLDDLSRELEEAELLDEESPVPYRIGDAYIRIPLSDARERVAAQLKQMDEEMENDQKEIDRINGEMTKLKAVLYGKFKNAINLEKD